MIEHIGHLPRKRQHLIRLMALSMEGPRTEENKNVLVPISLLGAIIWSLASIFG